jgi:hypothetical protein
MPNRNCVASPREAVFSTLITRFTLIFTVCLHDFDHDFDNLTMSAS